MLLDTDSKEILQQVKATLIGHPAAKKKLDDTDYLLSTAANKKDLLEGIKQLDAGEGKARKIKDLWK